MRILLKSAAAALAAAMPGSVSGQDTLRLHDLQPRAVLVDARHDQLGLLASQSALRLRSLSLERRPAFSLEGQAQYQSDVPSVTIPGGPPAPPHDTYDARVAATQTLLDPTLSARRAIENAQLAQSEAGVRVALYAARQQVSDAYFSALLAQSQRDELAAAIAALEAQFAVASARVREGAALPSEQHTISAELLRTRQALAAAEIGGRAALAVLADLVSEPVPADAVLALPDLAGAVADVRDSRAVPRSRPEFDRFDRSRDLLSAQERARSARDMPRVAAYGRAGYGRPGLNPLASDFDTYWLAGLQLQWAPWNWGSRDRDREVLELQRRMLDADERAFVQQVQRVVTTELATIERLETVLALDDEIIALRERIVAESRARFTESAITAAEFVTRQSELLSARLARALHRVELAQARARLLNTLGMEVR